MSLQGGFKSRGRTERRRREEETRGEEGREQGGERLEKAVAGISSPARQLITRRRTKNIPEHGAHHGGANTDAAPNFAHRNMSAANI